MAEPMKVYDWDDDVAYVGESFSLIEEGVYPFTVKSIERARYQGGAKMPACPQANVTLEVRPHGKTRQLTDRFYLCETAMWRVARFFECLGFDKDDETGAVRIAWNEIEGKEGFLRVGIRTWTGTDGKEHESNEVKMYFAPDEQEKALNEYIAQKPAEEPQQPQQQGWSV